MGQAGREREQSHREDRGMAGKKDTIEFKKGVCI
jgi:hypothetical protein